MPLGPEDRTGLTRKKEKAVWLSESLLILNSGRGWNKKQRRPKKKKWAVGAQKEKKVNRSLPVY